MVPYQIDLWGVCKS